MNDEFQVWVLVLGLALGAAITWFALGSAGRAADSGSLESDDEQALEADWLARELTRQGHPTDAETLQAALALHHDLLAGRAEDGGVAGDGEDAADGRAGNAGDAGRAADVPRAAGGGRAEAGRSVRHSVGADQDRFRD